MSQAQLLRLSPGHRRYNIPPGQGRRRVFRIGGSQGNLLFPANLLAQDYPDVICLFLIGRPSKV